MCAKASENYFVGHEIRTVEEVGQKGLKNGELLRAAANSRLRYDFGAQYARRYSSPEI